MRLNRLMFLIATTVLLGAAAGVVTSLTGLWLHVPWFTGLISGAFFSTTSLMGFWAYLTLNFIARVTLPQRVWRWAQMLILALVLYDMLYWRYHLHTAAGADAGSFWSSFWQGLWPVFPALAGAWAKRRLSGRGSFLPALFFLYVFTMLDSLPFIWFEYGSSQMGPLVNQTLLIMMICNLYLILIFGKLLSPAARPVETVDGPLPTRPDGVR
ncbi:KinB-signaling pathway activation protein [Alicyclobacillus sp.]|uniref:KinB-signaling pathway activation protein n=1 Tax=Alicyclobacillus sp. TaxID=61169 RepID=UPI0025C2FDE6|nr:KinB-signaling pathway activation protein [Alicyclobacillus sp.]MCL6516905.1 KinB-signaling pathway activation protein [Alicyclobacillus sp.]